MVNTDLSCRMHSWETIRCKQMATWNELGGYLFAYFDIDNLYIARFKLYVTSLSCLAFSSFVVAIHTLNRSSVK